MIPNSDIPAKQTRLLLTKPTIPGKTCGAGWNVRTTDYDLLDSELP